MAEETLAIVVDSSAGKRGVDSLSDAINRLKQSSESAETSTDRLFNRLNSSFQSIGNAFRTFVTGAGGANSAINGLASGIGGSGGGGGGLGGALNAAQPAFNQFNNGLKSVESHVLNLRNVIIAFGAVIGTFKLISDAITRFQSFISTMTATTGTVSASRAEFDLLAQMAGRLGVSVNDLTKNYAQLSAAAHGTKLSQEDLRRTFESFSIAARTLHLSGAETNLMFYAITQMVSKGTVSMEELRRQLGEKLPGAMNIAARSVNSTMQEFETAVRKGTVDSAKFLPIFAEAVREHFKGGLSIAATALDAEMNRLKNTLQSMIVVFYDLGVAQNFSNIIKELNRILGDKSVMESFANTLKKLSDQFTNFLKGITAEDIRRWVDNFIGGLKEVANFINTTVLPAVKLLADNIRILIEAWVIAKATAAGAAVGSVIPGLGTLAGGVTGFAAGAVAVGAGRGAFGNEGIMMNKGVTANTPASTPGPTGTELNQQVAAKTEAWRIHLGQMGIVMTDRVRNQILRSSDYELNELLKGLDYQNARSVEKARERMMNFIYPKQHTLADVMGPNTKGEKFNPLQQFISTLEQQMEGTGPMGNQYDAMRRKLEDIIKKTAPAERGGLGAKATQLIDQLEARGIEYLPLINRLESLMDRGNKDTPAILERLQTDLQQKYPNANTQITSKLSDLISRYREQEEGRKLVAEANYRQTRSLAEFGFSQEQYGIYQRIGSEEEKYNEQRAGLDLQADARERNLKQLELEKKLREDILRLSNEATQKGLSFNEDAFRKNAERDVNAVIAALKRLQDYQKSAEFGVKSAITSYMSELENIAAGVNQMVTGVFKGLEDALVQFTLTGEFNIKKLAQTFVEQLTRMYIQQQIMKPLVGSANDPGLLTQGLTAGVPWLLRAFGITGGTPSGGGLVGGGLKSGGGTGINFTGTLGAGLDYTPGLARGGRIGERALVGEEGPEIYVRGITTHAEAMQALSNALATKTKADDDIFQWIGKEGREIFTPPEAGFVMTHSESMDLVRKALAKSEDEMPHYAQGGPIGQTEQPTGPAIPRSSEGDTYHSNNVKVEVNVNVPTGQSTANVTGAAPGVDMSMVGTLIAQAVQVKIADMMRPGGLLWARGGNA